uniref:Uncharacterized protein n=1 Tax=Babesia bovis TaxID=5865 RepID=S6BP02_BABBO|nr:hypothetical protein [Babesia bovis]
MMHQSILFNSYKGVLRDEGKRDEHSERIISKKSGPNNLRVTNKAVPGSFLSK